MQAPAEVALAYCANHDGNGVIGFGSPNNLLVAEAADAFFGVCGFLVRVPFFGGSDGRAKVLPVYSQEVVRSSNLFEPPPSFDNGCGGLFNRKWEAKNGKDRSFGGDDIRQIKTDQAQGRR